MSRLMAKVLGHDLELYVYVYLDDVIIISKSLEEHLRCVAERLQRAGLTINLQKSKFCQTNIRYLGYVLSAEGLSTDVAKIQPVLDYPPPRTVKEVRRLLGLAGFYQNLFGAIPKSPHPSRICSRSIGQNLSGRKKPMMRCRN